jgi:DNA-directed RNA polymerase subunit N (RpoN/RPB10)
VKINCLGCGYKVDLANAYDDYEGQIKCFACGAILEIAAQEGSIRAVRSVTDVPLPLAAVGGHRHDMRKKVPA